MQISHRVAMIRL